MMSKVSTNFKNITPFTGWWVAKHVIGLESYLVEGDAYEITHKTIGDNYGEYYCIDREDCLENLYTVIYRMVGCS